MTFNIGSRNFKLPDSNHSSPSKRISSDLLSNSSQNNYSIATSFTLDENRSVASLLEGSVIKGLILL